MMKVTALVAASCLASVQAADYILWNAPSVSFDSNTLWQGGNPLGNDAIKSVAFGMADASLSVPIASGATLNGGMKITLNGMTKLVLGDGTGKATIKLDGSSSGASVTYKPGSDKSSGVAEKDRSSEMYDVNCRKNWVVVDSDGDLEKSDNGKVQYPTKGQFGKYTAIFDTSAKMYNADGSDDRRLPKMMIYASKVAEDEANFEAVYVGDISNGDMATCSTGKPVAIPESITDVVLDLGVCDKAWSRAQGGGVSIGYGGKLDGTRESTCEPEAILTIGDDADEELFQIGDAFVLINSDGEGTDVTDAVTFMDSDGNTIEVDDDGKWIDATTVSVEYEGGTYTGAHGRGKDALTTSTTATTTTITTVTETTKTTTTEEEDDDDDTPAPNPEQSGSAGKKKGGTTGIIVAVVIVLLVVIAGAIFYVKRAGGGGGAAGTGGVVSFENPMYDDAKGQSNPTYAQGGQGQSGYMDVPAGGAPAGGAGYMDVSPNTGGGAGYMDVSPNTGGGAGYMDVSPNAGGGAGYMDVSPNAGGSSGYMDVGGAEGGYMDGSDGEEDV